ncbi:TPA: phage holin [Streptococcus pyogenes]|nr:phage holin [Streptococcus pyogenes]
MFEAGAGSVKKVTEAFDDLVGSIEKLAQSKLDKNINLAKKLGLSEETIKLPSNIADIANTAVTLLVLLGVVTDPTTKGLSDSEQALTYHEPKK